MTAWTALIIAGFFEMGFTTSLKLSEGFTKWPYIILFLISGGFSFYFLSQAVKTLPLGTAYAVWTGIGAFGTALIGMVFFEDPVGAARLVLLTVLLGSIAGLKLIS